MQATGRDARRRKVYRYHDRWREVRDAHKYEHTIAFARALPRIRRRVARDMARAGLPREKVLACAVPLLEARAAAEIRNDLHRLSPEEAAVLGVLQQRLGREGRRRRRAA